MSPEHHTLRLWVSRIRVEVLSETRAGDVVTNRDELRVQELRRNYEGGPLPGSVKPAVYVTHVPTGITAFCQPQKAAMALLHARLARYPRRVLDGDIGDFLPG